MKIQLKIPPLRDPRYLQVTALLAYAIVAREVFHFERTHVTTLLCCLWAVVLDFALGALFFKRVLFPLSPMIIALSSSLLIYSHSVWAYLAVVTFAELSKAFLTYKGKHFFNPSDFGVVLVLQLGGQYAIGYPALFSGYLVPVIIFMVIGLATIIYARQTEVALSWVFGFILFAFVRALIGSSSPWAKLAPILGPSFLLFTFHMISDPSTVPKSRRFRVLFGLLVAFVDAIYRFLEIPYGFFYALFLTSCLMPWVRDFEEKVQGSEPAAQGKFYLFSSSKI